VLAAPPGAHQAQLLSIFFEHTVIGDPGPLPATARGRALVLDMTPQRDEHLQPQASKPLEPGALGQCPENLGRQVLVPAAHAREFRGGATAKEGREHHTKDFPQQPLLASQAAFDLLDEIVRQANVMQGLVEGRDGPLCLGMVTLEAFSGNAATALSGFGVALLIGCGPSHSVLLLMGVTTWEKRRRP